MVHVVDHTEFINANMYQAQGLGSVPVKKWCQVCGENSSHITQDCHHIARMAREFQARGPHSSSTTNNPQTEQAPPVLGTQPHAPGMVGLRYVGANETMLRMELVSVPTYQMEEDYPYTIDQLIEFWAPQEESVEYNPRDSRELMLLGPQPRPTTQMRRPSPSFVQADHALNVVVIIG